MSFATRAATLFALLLVSVLGATAQDTIVVKTLTFQDTTKRSGTWLFPPPQSYEKVIMEYTLKCDPATTQDNFPCGEWDYLTYTMITDSTGEYDSTRRTQVNFSVGGGTPDSLPWASEFVPQKRRFRETPVTGSTSGEWQDVGSGGQGNDGIITPDGGRARYLWTATELTNAGLSAGPISAVRMRALDSVDQIRLLTVRIAQTSSTEVPQFTDDLQMTTVVRRTVDLDDGQNDLLFSSPFQWDGTSNLIIEFSCLDAPSGVRLESGPSSPSGLQDDGSRRAYQFRSGDMMVLPQDVADQLSTEITVSFWSWGDPDVLPANHNAFEAFNAQDQRVMNVHLPWSNGNVYWDAGRVGGNVDRIEKAAPESAYEGRWNHWAFVKNATAGTMEVYLNGELFHSGNGKTHPMTGITRFHFGNGNAGSYPGVMDEIRIWKKALDQATIASWMHRGVTDLHPQFTDLIAYYTAENDDDPTTARDASSTGGHATLFGLPTRVHLYQDEYGVLTRSSSGRPFIALAAGTASVQTDRRDIDVDQEPRRLSVVRYREDVEARIYRPGASDHPTIPVDTVTVQPAGWQPIVDEAGLVADSLYVEPDQVLYRNNQVWFDPIVVYEIGRYITPYGIGLDLGPEGFMWIFDVTDYAPLLRNNVTMRAGNQQELIDVTFKFIKGTPPRDIKQIDQLWSNRNAEFVNILNGTELTPVDVTLSPEATMFRVKTWTSGHRFSNPTNCAEFCERIHSISLNGTTTHEWLLWTECGDNPVYPQGGTWLIDRAGWCPGAPVDLYDHELPAAAVPGTTVSLDYDVKKEAAEENWGIWDVTGQLIGYGDPNHELDAAIIEVIRPNDWEYFQRLNPICGEPLVIIQNTGATTLTSATITYGVVDGEASTYEWSGSLGFLEKDTVALPIPAWPQQEGAFQFEAVVSAPNNGTDEYANNDRQVRNAVMPPVFYSDLEINLRTNNFADEQYEWVLRKIDDGTIVDSGKDLDDNRAYVYAFDLEDGCYEFELVNLLGYGLDFWFLRDQLGTGSLLFKSGGVTTQVFEPDFGNRAWIQFTVAPKPTIATSEDTLRFVTPNVEPVERTVAITANSSAPLVIDSVNVFSIRDHFFITDVSTELPTTLNEGDTIYATVSFDRPDAGSSSGTMRIYSNDERMNVKPIRLLGTSGVSSVDELSDLHHTFELGVVPNPVTSDGQIMVNALKGALAHPITVTITDAVGRTVATVFSGTMSADALTVPVPSGLSAGSYRVVLMTEAGRISSGFVVTR